MPTCAARLAIVLLADLVAVTAIGGGLAMLAGYIFVEILILQQVSPGPTWIELTYLLIMNASVRRGACYGSAQFANAPHGTRAT